MRRTFLKLIGVTTVERHQAITAVSDAISASGGWIVDHTLFSNVMATIRFAVPLDGAEGLKDRLKAAGIRLDADTPAPALPGGAGTAGAQDDIPGSLNLTFIHNEPDLRIEVPAIPG